jgi:acyl carrier protein
VEYDGSIFTETMTKQAFQSVLEEILRVPPGGLSENDTRESVETWSSLADVEIMTVIGSELGIDAELMEYHSVGELFSLLEERAAFTA